MRINKLLDDPELAMRMGKAARKSAQEVFSTKRFVDRWNGLFTSVGAQSGL